MANKKISDLTNMSGSATIDRAVDMLEISDISASTTYKATPNFILGISGAPVGDTDSQSLTNKTLGNTNTVTLKDTLFTLQDDGDTSKQAKFQLSGITTATTRTYTLPNASGTLVDLASSQTLTNKTLTSPTINTATISNPTLTVDSISEFTGSNGVTISGLNIKNSALNTANSVPNSALSNTGSFGSAWAWTSWTPTFTNLTVGNGTHASKYSQIGKTVFFRMQFTLGTTSVVGTSPNFTLPVTSVSLIGGSQIALGRGVLFDTSAASYFGASALYNSTTTSVMAAEGSAGAIINYTSITSLVPFTWATGDTLASFGMYEGA